MDPNHAARLREGQVGWLEERVAELSVLLPGSQAVKLERLAYFQGLTVGQLIRLLIGDYLMRLNDQDLAGQLGTQRLKDDWGGFLKGERR
jgi:hypothetical protein